MNDKSLTPELLQKAVLALPKDELADMRWEAAQRFANIGFPVTGTEDWKYTNLAEIVELTNSWLDGLVGNIGNRGEDFNETIVQSVMDRLDAHWIIVRDGLVDSDITGPQGITIEKISAVTRDIVTGNDAMSVFNAALLRDGLHIRVETETKPGKPLGILYLDRPSNAVAQNRTIIEVTEQSRLQVVECSLSAAAGRQFTNSVVDLSIAKGACVDHVRIQDRKSGHAGINRINALLGQNANYNHNSFDLGGGLTRTDLVTEIDGKGASVHLNGLYIGSGDQHIDNHTNILHNVGPSTSTEEYRGIVSGHSQCVFNGRVFVAEGADGTDSSQYNHNILLSDRAEINTKPELEIYADDVKCAHGATVGQLDQSALFYLRSRGLDLEESQQVLTRAFASGTLSKLTIDACHDYLTDLLDKRLESLVGGSM